MCRLCGKAEGNQTRRRKDTASNEPTGVSCKRSRWADVSGVFGRSLACH